MVFDFLEKLQCLVEVLIFQKSFDNCGKNNRIQIEFVLLERIIHLDGQIHFPCFSTSIQNQPISDFSHFHTGIDHSFENLKSLFDLIRLCVGLDEYSAGLWGLWDVFLQHEVVKRLHFGNQIVFATNV